MPAYRCSCSCEWKCYGTDFVWCVTPLRWMVSAEWRNEFILYTPIDKPEPEHMHRHQHPYSLVSSLSYTHTHTQPSPTYTNTTRSIEEDKLEQTRPPTAPSTVRLIHTGELIWGIKYRLLLNELNIIFVASAEKKLMVYNYMGIRRQSVFIFYGCGASIRLTNYGASWHLLRDEYLRREHASLKRLVPSDNLAYSICLPPWNFVQLQLRSSEIGFSFEFYNWVIILYLISAS